MSTNIKIEIRKMDITLPHMRRPRRKEQSSNFFLYSLNLEFRKDSKCPFLNFMSVVVMEGIRRDAFKVAAITLNMRDVYIAAFKVAFDGYQKCID